MVETVNYQCPACGGPLHYSSDKHMLQCDYCDSTFTVSQIEQLYAAKQEKAEAKADKEARRENRAAQISAEDAHEAAPGAAAAHEAAQTGAAAAHEAEAAPGATATHEAEAAPGAAQTPTQAAAAAAQTSAQGAVPDAVVAAGCAESAKAAKEGLDPIQAYLKRSNWNDEESETLTSSICSSCGAEFIHDKTTAVAQCPYCGNNTVIPGTMAGALKPDYVIPFKLNKDHAVAALEEYYKGKKFLPDTFAANNHLKEVQGVYVPFWLYSTRTNAQASYNAQNVRSWRQGDYQITETDFYHVERAGHMDFSRVPVDGSQKMPDAHMDSIEPFDYTDLQPFSIAYLPGYLTDRFDMDAATCQPRVEKRVETTAASALNNTVTGYSLVETKGCRVDTNITNVSYALFPVWMLHTKWNDEDFLFAMNGQTGKLIGDLPIDKGKVVKWFLRVFIPSVAIVGVAAFLLL